MERFAQPHDQKSKGVLPFSCAREKRRRAVLVSWERLKVDHSLPVRELFLLVRLRLDEEIEVWIGIYRHWSEPTPDVNRSNIAWTLRWCRSQSHCWTFSCSTTTDWPDERRECRVRHVRLSKIHGSVRVRCRDGNDRRTDFSRLTRDRSELVRWSVRIRTCWNLRWWEEHGVVSERDDSVRRNQSNDWRENVYRVHHRCSSIEAKILQQRESFRLVEVKCRMAAYRQSIGIDCRQALEWTSFASESGNDTSNLDVFWRRRITWKVVCRSRSGEWARLVTADVMRDTLGVVMPIASTLMLLFSPMKNSPCSS